MKHRTFFAWALLTAILLASSPAGAQQFGPWSAPVNLGCTVNSFKTDAQPFLSKDALSLFFSSGRVGPGFKIYASQRESVDAPWGEPRDVGPAINFPDFAAPNPTAPTLSPDEHLLFFMSERPTGAFGGMDLYVSWRHNRKDDFGWQPAVNLGPTINTESNETTASFFQDEATGHVLMYFQSTRPEGFGGADIWASSLQEDHTFSAPALVQELSTSYNDNHPAVTRDGLEMYLASDRPGTFSPTGGADIFVSTRASTADLWSPPVPVPGINSAFVDNRPAISADGAELYFMSSRPYFCVDPTGVIKPHGQDLWMSKRTKLRD